MHPGTPRDVDLAEWLNATGFHPADTTRKQLTHEAVRRLFGEVGTILHQLLPPGRAKSVAFTELERSRIYANMAAAVGGGPGVHVTEGDLRALLARMVVALPIDPRIEEYEAGQRGEKSGTVQPLGPFEYQRGRVPGMVRILEAGLTGTGGGSPEAKIQITEHDEGENLTQGSEVFIDDPAVLEEFASYVLTMASQLRALKARQV